MPFINLEGEREATTQNSEEYGKKVISFLNLQDYHVEHDSNIEGMFQDKIFRNIKLDGDKKTVVEIKDTQLSLSNKDFLKEFGKYFLISLKEDFNLFIFARKAANPNKWKSIFDLTKQKEADVKKFIAAVKKETNEKKIDYELFLKFINSTKVYQCSYDKLLQKIEQIKSDNIYDSGADYLVETENLVYETEKLDSNVLLIKSFPKKLFYSTLKKKSKFNSIWKSPFADKYVQYKGNLYSINKIPEEIMSEYCSPGSENEINFSDMPFEGEEKDKLITRLIKSQIIVKAFDEKFYYDRSKKVLYKPHHDLKTAKQKVKVEKEKLRYLSKIYPKKDGSFNFVLHRGLIFEVFKLNGQFFVSFDNFRLFSSDGKRLIPGEKAKKLNYKFPPTKAFNDAEKSKLHFVIKATGLFKFNMFKMNQFTFKKVHFEMPCKAKFGEIFNENFDYEENIYPQLTDFYEE